MQSIIDTWYLIHFLYQDTYHDTSYMCHWYFVLHFSFLVIVSSLRNSGPCDSFDYLGHSKNVDDDDDDDDDDDTPNTASFHSSLCDHNCDNDNKRPKAFGKGCPEWPRTHGTQSTLYAPPPITPHSEAEPGSFGAFVTDRHREQR